MNNRQQLLQKLTAQQFAAFDMQLYLDTHPWDEKALRMFNAYHTAVDEYRQEYELRYGPLSADTVTDGSWDWIADPWPWERSVG